MVIDGVGGCGRRGIVLVLIKGSRPASNHITESEHDTGRYKKHLVLAVHHKYSLPSPAKRLAENLLSRRVWYK